MTHHMLYIAPHPQALTRPGTRRVDMPHLNGTVTFTTARALQDSPHRLRGLRLCKAIGIEHVDLRTEQIITTRLITPDHECPLNWADLTPYVR